MRPFCTLVLPRPGFDEAVVDYSNLALLLGHPLETSLFLHEATRPSQYGNREIDLHSRGYWSSKTSVLSFKPGVVQTAVASALHKAQRAARLEDSPRSTEAPRGGAPEATSLRPGTRSPLDFASGKLSIWTRDSA